jgi:type II secretory pathway pseudopilin PulG
MKHACEGRRAPLPRTRERRMGRQRGATLLEAVAFLGIAAIILIGAIALFTNAFEGARSNQLTEEVTAIENGARKIYATGAGLPANVTAGGIGGLVQAGVIPTSLTVDTVNNTVEDEWGGTVSLAMDATSNAAEISFTKVPQPVCIAALTAGGDWSGVSTSVATTLQTVPLTAANATTACTGTSVTVNWEFNN